MRPSARRLLPVRRRAPERALAWLYTGPLGHLYGLLADVTVLWVRYARSRVRDR
jgi:hypothetical protein